MTRHVFIWFVLTYTYYQTCSAYSLLKFDQNPNYKSPLYGSFEREIHNLESVKEKSQAPQNTPYSSVIQNLRSSWSMPSVYLQKRGYIKNIPKYVPHGFQDEIEDKNDDFKNNALTPSRKVSRDTKNEIEPDDKDSGLENDEKGAPDTPTVEHVVKEVTTPKPGFFKKISNFFTRKNTSSLTEEEEESALKELTDSLNLLQNDYDHELYDVNALQNPSENVIDWSLPKRSYQNVKNNDNNNYNWIQKPFVSNCPERPTVEHNIFAKDVNSDELFKNLTQTDIEYVKNFLKCFKENKSKFVTEYLHVSPPPPHSEKSNATTTPTSSAAASNSTTVQSASNSSTAPSAPNSTTKPIASVLLNCSETSINNNKTKETAMKNLTVTASAVNATKTNTSECSTEANDLNTPGLNSTNSTQNGCKPNENVNVKTVSLDLLKFLAHMHHDVTQVGKPPHKPINLKSFSNNSDVLGADSSKNCTPFRLNELSLDLEVASANNSKTRSPLSLNYIKKRSSEIGTNNDWNRKDIIGQFLEGHRGNQLNSFRIQSPYADNFLDQVDTADGDSHSQDIDKGNHFLSKFSKKREVAHSEEEILSDISSSLSKLAFDPLTGKGNDDDLEKIKGDICNEEDYYDDEERSNQRRYDGKLEHRNRKKKKNRKLHMRDDVDARADEPKAAIAESEIGSKDMFSDFQDIKFRMNPRQEEDIQTFIESLNSPPEIFSFDVDKYIKQSDRVTKELKPDPVPQRKYYEFIETPALENEQIPLFQPNLEASKEMAKNEIALNLEHTEKRDLLRQYIKGVSNKLHSIDKMHDEVRNIKDPFEKRSQQKFSNEETPMFVNNYPQNYENVYAQKLHDKKQKETEEVDDFVDKYYLLNDGSVQIYHPQKINLKQSYDPDVLQMDLDLNKKFKDLTLTRGAYNQIVSENEEG